MEMKTPGKGSAGTAILLALLILILVVSTVYVFSSGKYNPPGSITHVGREIDSQYHLTLWVTGIVFVLSQLGLAYAIIRFRDHGQRVEFSRGNNMLEVLWTTATIVLFLGLGVMARHAWAETHFVAPDADAIRVETTGTQFVWNFRYPGPDGKFGRLDPKQISASSGNPLGLVPEDPAGKDDIVVPTLTVPVNRQVELLLRSQDVIHSFFVRELRLKQDAMPGMIIPMMFTATKIGQYEIVCTQLCGLGHYRMRSFLNVVSEEDYQKFLKDQEQLLLPPPAAAASDAAATASSAAAPASGK
jgi:cytochrome c oxidase subunit II